MTPPELPAPPRAGVVRTLRYVRVDPEDPRPGLAADLEAGWAWDGRVVFPASGRAELATVLLWRDEAGP